jgi:hypothetical protein
MPGTLHPPVLPSAMRNDVGTLVAIISQLNTQPTCALSTLRHQPCDWPRMTRGQDGSLLLSCMTLSFTRLHAGLSRRTPHPARDRYRATGTVGAGHARAGRPISEARDLCSAGISKLTRTDMSRLDQLSRHGQSSILLPPNFFPLRRGPGPAVADTDCRIELLRSQHRDYHQQATQTPGGRVA